VVRGPAALLGAPLLALGYFLLAPELPALSGDTELIVCGTVGLGAIGACALAALLAREQRAGLVLLAWGAGLIAAALTAGNVGAPANPFRALMAAALGILFARALPDRRALVALPLIVAGVDAWSVAAGPSHTLISEQPRAVDFLTFALPTWGGGGAQAGQVGLSDIVFLAMFGAWAAAFGLRRKTTTAALLLALVGALVLSVALDTAIPVLPLLAAALLLPNSDRIVALFGEPPEGLHPPPPAST
jgi:hypothetical protein